jgi:hypothetical protein
MARQLCRASKLTKGAEFFRVVVLEKIANSTEGSLSSLVELGNSTDHACFLGLGLDRLMSGASLGDKRIVIGGWISIIAQNCASKTNQLL